MFYVNAGLAIIFGVMLAIDLFSRDYSWTGAKGSGLCVIVNSLCAYTY